MTGVTELGGTAGARVGSAIVIVLLLAPMAALGTAPHGGNPPEVSESREYAPTALALQVQNNSTVRHENPEEVGRAGDLGRVESWFFGRLAGQLTESSIQLSRGEYELARQYVDDDYRDLLGKYVDVEGDTRENAERSEVFERARDRQATLTSTVEEYNETLRQYREAKAAGDTSRARQLARRLERLSGAVNETSETLLTSTRRLSDLTGVELSRVEQVTHSISASVDAQQREIRAAEFVETRLAVDTETPNTSFVQPLVLQGRLTTLNGSSVSNRVVRVSVGDRTFRTRTDGAGRFRLAYRPTTMPLNTSQVTVRYVPVSDSIYLGSAAQIPITVSQVLPEIHLARTPSAAAYGERFTVTGSVEAGDIGAENVPVEIHLQETRLGVVRTNASGTFAFTTALPARVQPGEQPLRAVVPLENRALGPATASTAVTIRETPTNLSIALETDDSGKVTVSGRLETADGRVVGDQPVRVQVAGRTVRTVQTDTSGQYTGTFDVFEVVAKPAEGNELSVAAEFTGQGTNLRPARAEATAVVPPARTGASPSDAEPAPPTDPIERATQLLGPILALPLTVLLLISLAAAGVVFAIVRWRPVFVTKGDEPATATEARPTSAPGERPPTEAGPSVIDTVREHLSNGGPDTAIRVAYGITRTRLATELDLDPGATHWELYTEYAGSNVGVEETAAVRDVVRAFEQAAFAAETASRATAETALAAFERLWGAEQ